MKNPLAAAIIHHQKTIITTIITNLTTVTTNRATIITTKEAHSPTTSILTLHEKYTILTPLDTTSAVLNGPAISTTRSIPDISAAPTAANNMNIA